MSRAATYSAGPYERFLKRPLDVVVAGSALVALIPVFAAAAIATFISLGRPVILRQTRVGRDGEEFAVLKFRSMRPDRRVTSVGYAGHERRRVHKSPHDPRITRVGHFTRRTSIDELPQLLNVLVGDMSLVGPRPELSEIVAGYQPWQHLRHQVKPGITGLWQITARDADELMHERTEIDLEYVDQVSLVNDVRILASTVPSVLNRSLSTGSESAVAVLENGGGEKEEKK